MALTQSNPNSKRTQALVYIGQRDGSICRSDKAAVCRAVQQFPDSVCVSGSIGSVLSLRYALAAGAKKVVSADYQADVVIFGRAGTGPDGDLRPAAMAIGMNACLVLDVLDFQLEVVAEDSANFTPSLSADDPNLGALKVTRDLGRGVRETLTCDLPAILVMAETATPPFYVSRFRQLQADATLPVELPQKQPPKYWDTLRPRTVAKNLEQKTSGSATNRVFDTFGLAEITTTESSESVIESDPETCAAHLLRYLAHHKLLDLHADVDSDETSPISQVISSTCDSRASDRRQNSVAVSSSAGRGPRPLHGECAMHRRPRAYLTLPAMDHNVRRRPRPVGTQIQSNHRGPFPV